MLAAFELVSYQERSSGRSEFLAAGRRCVAFSFFVGPPQEVCDLRFLLRRQNSANSYAAFLPRLIDLWIRGLMNGLVLRLHAGHDRVKLLLLFGAQVQFLRQALDLLRPSFRVGQLSRSRAHPMGKDITERPTERTAQQEYHANPHGRFPGCRRFVHRFCSATLITTSS